MRDASLEEGASRQQKIGAISFFFFFSGPFLTALGQLWLVSAWLPLFLDNL